MTGKYHHGDLAGALVRAAVEILEAEGLDALTLRACARRAGVSHAAPAHHFRDRRGLLSAVAGVGFEQKAALMRAARAAAGGDARAALAGVGRAYVAFALAHPALFGLMHRCASLDMAQPQLHAASTEVRDHLIQSLVAASAGAATLAAAEVGARATLAWSAVHGFAQLAIDGAFGTAPAELDGLLEPMITVMLPALTGERGERGAVSAAQTPPRRPRTPRTRASG